MSVLESKVGAELNDEGLEPLKNTMAIVVADRVCQRLVEAASLHLLLVSEVMTEAQLTAEDLDRFEMIVADDAVARRLRDRMGRNAGGADEINPSVVSVVGRGLKGTTAAEGGTHAFEGVLELPQEPAAIVAQLGVLLYAHRAYARRYQSALEELNLNRRIFRSVTSGISVASASLRDLPLVYVNPAFEVMTGYSLEEVLGLNCRFLQGEETEQAGVTLIREAIKAEREVVATIRNFKKDGTPFWNELSLSPIRSRAGVLTHFVGIQSDVTSRVEFEAALRQSEKLAAVGRLAASIAHEINNPLESVMNLLYLASTGEVSTQAREYLAQADKELQRVAQITTQSLRFYKQSTRPQAVKTADLLQGVLDLYEGRMENAGVKLELRGRMNESIVCLESEIRQVLSNLVRNGIDAMASTGGRLLVRSREATEWKTQKTGVVLTIADTGTGISKETMRQIYTAFFTTKGIQGTGLGLWVSAEIIERHGGRLLVKSVEGRGTVFQVFLPYQGLPV